MNDTSAQTTTPVLDATDLLENFLQYQEQYDGQVVGFKYGGELAEDAAMVREIARQCAIMTRGQRGPLLFGVHGGGDAITAALAKEGIERVNDSKGKRITNPDVMRVADRELGLLNKSNVRIFNAVSSDVQAVGLAAYDGRLVTAQAFDPANNNYAGRVTKVNTGYLSQIMNRAAGNYIPLIYPIAYGPDAEATDYRINVNADDLAAEIAMAMKAKRFLMLSNIPGILDKEKNLISTVSTDDVAGLIEDGTITGGMIPKAEGARDVALELGSAGGVAIIDGRKRSTMLNELLGMGGGTLVRAPGMSPK